jgi:hypothetical protein
MLQPICEFIHVKHIWRKTLGAHANGKLWSILVQIEKH